MKIEPKNASKAVLALYHGTRNLELPAHAHDVHKACHDGLQAFITEAEANAAELAELKKPKEPTA